MGMEVCGLWTLPPQVDAVRQLHALPGVVCGEARGTMIREAQSAIADVGPDHDKGDGTPWAACGAAMGGRLGVVHGDSATVASPAKPAAARGAVCSRFKPREQATWSRPSAGQTPVAAPRLLLQSEDVRAMEAPGARAQRQTWFARATASIYRDAPATSASPCCFAPVGLGGRLCVCVQVQELKEVELKKAQVPAKGSGAARAAACSLAVPPRFLFNACHRYTARYRAGH